MTNIHTRLAPGGLPWRCTACNGSGCVPRIVGHANRDSMWALESCPACDGFGVTDEKGDVDDSE